jgi:peptidoglycan hydrolase-like amidase
MRDEMKKYPFDVFILSFCLLYSGTVWAQTFGPVDAVETTAAGVINWTVGEVYAKGIGAPPAFPGNAAQARAMAERAAYIVALRNLLETVKGVRVDADTVVENYMVKSDVIRTRVDGIVRAPGS